MNRQKRKSIKDKQLVSRMISKFESLKTFSVLSLSTITISMFLSEDISLISLEVNPCGIMKSIAGGFETADRSSSIYAFILSLLSFIFCFISIMFSGTISTEDPEGPGMLDT
jgi:hypothetical protein